MDNNIDVPVKMEKTAVIDNKDLEEKQATEAPVKKSVKEEKSRKKDDKSVEQVLKALNSLETTEEKLAAMCKKYSDIVDENRKLQLTVKQTEKRLSMVQREKEQLQTEHSKAVLTRSRLESLCRELQRQNKAIKDESLLKIREEEEKRKEVSAKFQSTLNEITALMQQNNEKNAKLREDNLEMTKKFKTVCEQYELREQQVEKITKQMQLEAQLADAKLAKAKMEMAAEKEMLLKEKQQLLMDLTEYQAKCQELQTTEVNLRSQISLYTDKYDEFQNALSRSNEVFGGFKGEMEKMSKKICKLEKETSSWKQRWEKSHQALLEMAADKQQRDSELALATRQLAQLQKLCRTLQAERTSLLAQLRTEGASKTVPVPAGKVESSIEPLQLDQDQLCIHEPEKDGTEIEACSVHTSTQSQNIENIASDQHTLPQSQSDTRNTENILIDAIASIDISQNPLSTAEGTVPNVLENTNGLLIEQDLPSLTIEQTVQETSPVNSSEPSVGLPGMQGGENDDVPHLENEIPSIKTASEKSPASPSVNDSTSPSNNETSSDSLVNGQVPDPSEVKNNLIEELTNDAPAKHVAENETAEQIPIKTSSTETKKGKEGGKKRKNK